MLAAALRASPDSDNGDVLPHATDQAVVEGAAAAGVLATDCVGAWDPLADIAFEPARGFHAVLGRTPSGPWVVAKGAPEVVLPRCRSWRTNDGGRPLDRRARRQLDDEADRLARQGLRILAVAEAAAGEGSDFGDADVADLELVGFIALADLVRPTAAAAVDSVRRAGVDVAMVTGDHPRTAQAIAAELGILNGGKVLAGPELDRLPDMELDAALSGTTVFARITPAQKVRIVEAYQRAGRVVAMTGDGANDAAAIRLADAGVALGRRGTPTAREAADLVVTDDRIETIVDAIVEGRAMWASVRDALAVLIGGNLGEVGFALAGSALTGRSPLTPRQLLLVNLLTDMLPAMAIALRPPPGVDPEALLREGPDASLGATLARDIALRAVATAGGATGAWLTARSTGPPARARTVGLVALVGTQLGQTALVGSRSPLVLGASAVSAGVLAAIVQTPGISQFFDCTPLDPIGWATAFGSASVATGATLVLPWAAARLGRHL
ncbi:MAG TPA: cation-translocating P-type ATPase [Acidimicrobiales bacterium]|nr:cation-translocating P-type ATPase [Acidimicrobiales bacterium]